MKLKYCSCECGEVITFVKIGKQFVDIKHYIEWLTTSESGQREIVRSQRKAIEKIKKDKFKKDKELKESVKTISQWKSELQALVNLIARLIDYEQPCIATGSFKGKKNAGHFMSVGSNPSLRYNLHNIHIQSEHSNNFKGGDTLKYIAGLKNIYGLDYFNKVNELNQIKPIKLTVLEIREAISKCRKIVKELKEKGYIYSTISRMSLRDLYNNEIGIY